MPPKPNRLLSWLRPVAPKARLRPPVTKRSRPRHGLTVERLEDRLVPSFQMHVTTGTGANLLVTDGDANDLAASTAGAIVFSGSVGNFFITVDTGVSKPLSGSAASPDMDLSFSSTKS